MLLLLFLGLLPHLTRVESSVVLTYPKARFPPLDYLPSNLTQPPCGVPKPTKPFYTSLVIGEEYEASWLANRIADATYTLRIVDSDGITVEQLAQINSTDERTSTFHVKKACEQCMLVLEQQRNGANDVFRSCADVNVVEATEQDMMEECSRAGNMINGTCQCDNGYTGEKCELYAHCQTDSDCMNGGKCVEDSSSLIRKRCYCPYGFFGDQCGQRFNSPNDKCFAYSQRDDIAYHLHAMFNPECYSHVKLNDRNDMYTRRIDNEVEIILDFATSEWASIGWRPMELPTSCRLFPMLEDGRGRETEMDAISRLHVVAKPPMPKDNGFTAKGLTTPLNAMDCIDVVMGNVIDGELLSIGDYYSRDRSTPLQDYWYDGEMSLSAAYGVKTSNRTIVMFRREIREFEPTDHPLGPGEVLVAWSVGQQMNGQLFASSKDRGVDVLLLAQEVEATTISSNELAFGVKNIVQDHIDPLTSFPTTMSSVDTTQEETTTDVKPRRTTSEPTTTTTKKITTTTTMMMEEFVEDASSILNTIIALCLTFVWGLL